MDFASISTMNYFEKLSHEKYRSVILISLFLAAFFFRLLVLVSTLDIPGDGPTRAIQAYTWSQSPRILTHGIWLPGFRYLIGSFYWIVDDPLVSSRILNMMLGVLTVPLFYLLVRKTYGHTHALFSASILVFLPLHLGLSASSLSEASFSFEIIAGILCLILATEKTRNRMLYFSLSLLCLCWAEMTRYESWILIPAFPIYFYWKTKKLPMAVLMALVLVAFPISWQVGNYFETGDLLYGAGTARAGAAEMGTHGVPLHTALYIIIRKAVFHLGIFIPITILWGTTLEVLSAARRRIDAQRGLMLGICFLFWGFMTYVGMVRGTSLTDRYLLLGFLIALPFAVMPFVGFFSHSRKWFVIFILVGVISIGISKYRYHVPTYVTTRQPTEIRKIASWLKQSPYKDDPILMTKMGWQSSYLPLYYPEVGSFTNRYFIIGSNLVSDSMLLDYLKNRKPSLLFTREGEDELLEPIEAVLGRKLDLAQPVHTEGTIKVYDIRLMTQNQIASSTP